MTATNHALTGAFLGLVIGNPIVAIPLAVMSHFTLDAIPHFGFQDEEQIAGNRFALLLSVEATLCFSIVLTLELTRPAHWLVAAVCSLAAACPDFMWIPRFIRYRHHKPQKPERGILWFHHTIQWFQRPIGAVVEMAWFGGVLVLLAPFIL